MAAREECQFCKDTGFVVYNKKIKEVNVEYVARCECPIGEVKSKRIPSLAQVGLLFESFMAKKRGEEKDGGTGH